MQFATAFATTLPFAIVDPSRNSEKIREKNQYSVIFFDKIKIKYLIIAMSISYKLWTLLFYSLNIHTYSWFSWS